MYIMGKQIKFAWTMDICIYSIFQHGGHLKYDNTGPSQNLVMNFENQCSEAAINSHITGQRKVCAPRV